MNFKTLKRAWIIAEIGVNHEGSEEVAADLIRKAAAAGADAVKFQTFVPEHYVSTEQPERFERVGRFCLSHDAFRRLAALARSLGLTFFSTPLGFADIDFLDEIQPIFKISSGDLTFLALIRHATRTRKPLIISTGLGTEAEIQAAVNVVLEERPSAREDGSVMLMHCVSAYPTPAEEANLRNVTWLARRFGMPTGYSDHTLGIKACELAIAVGAVALEKHFTYRKEDQAFHDHKLSADPADLAALVAAVRQAERYLGSEIRTRTEAELKMELHMRRSIGTVVDIPVGLPVKREWLTWLRPAWGLGPQEMERIIGKPLNKALKAGALVRAEDLTS
ncbi:MAG: N-acetylneuraminate synthase family protein [Nitrospirota bacterium]|nr:N-acetylneuraminate synthase family protein [Nitrospirota bacterium]